MANHLSMDKAAAVLHLHAQGWSQRRIAEAVGVDRKTVRRHLRRNVSEESERLGSKGTSAPTGSQPEQGLPGEATEEADAKGGDAAESPAGVSASRHGATSSLSQCEAFREIIEGKLHSGLSAQRIFQDLQTEQAFEGSYYSVRRFVRKLTANQPQAFRRVEVPPGREAQVDFGTGAPVVGADGRRRKTHVLRVVLGHSRKGYSEVVFRQTTDAFIAALENAFLAFGGVPETVVIDNLKAAVTKADWYDPELNPKLRAFAAHYGTTILPTKPYTPRHKGKVERGVDYVQENALKGKRFESLSQQNQYLADWDQNVADRRIHGTTRKQVGTHFEEVERRSLRPLPIDRFANFHEGRRKVSRDGHVAVEQAYYSAPPEYLGRTVWVRWDARTVRLLDDSLRTITVHARIQEGQFSSIKEHIATEKVNSIERGTSYLLRRASFIGANSQRWSEAMLAQRGVEGHRVLQGLLALSRKHTAEQIEQACDVAWRHGEYRLRSVRRLIDRQVAVQTVMPFLEDHEIIRSLSDYDRYVHDCVQGGMQNV